MAPADPSFVHDAAQLAHEIATTDPTGWRVAVVCLNLLLGGIVWTVRTTLGRIATEIETVAEQLRLINGRLGRTEQWQIDHQQSDDRLHQHVQRLETRMDRQ